MPLTDQQISTLAHALENPPPAWDPEWAVTRALLEAVLWQSGRIHNLEERIRRMRNDAQCMRSTGLKHLAVAASAEVSATPVSDADAAAAGAAMDQAIAARESGAATLAVAGKILKFVSVFV